ncbi:MAG: GNAT family N-acetyltransferase [Thermoguttaceae bacterium]|jgi:CelD/BcsL family acetyltransferase involved in cellulose biosynthesis
MLEVREINQIEDLREFRLPWQALLARTLGASFFHSLEWLECYWKHFAAGQQLRILVVTESGQPVGIVPLVVRTESTRVGRIRMLSYPLHDWASFFGPIGPNPSAALVASLRHVRQSPRNWDVLDLRWVDVDGADFGRTERAMAQTGFRPCGQKWDRTSLVELPENWPAYWEGREAKFRKNIDRLQRRMAKQGKMELVRYRPEPALDGEADSRWDLFDACVTLARRSWQGERGDKTNLCHAEVSGFFRDAHRAAARLGAVDACLLYFNDDPAAFIYNYRWHGAVYGLRRGFDPRFKHLRPGLVLQKMMLEDGYRRGDRCYDLGTGSHDTKQAWRTSLRTSYRFTFFPTLVFRAQLLWWNRWLRRRLHGEHDIACSQVV